MRRIEKRISHMEKATAHVDLKAMSDDGLLAYAGKYPMFSSEMYAAIVTLVLRRPSAFPVVYDDPDYESTDYSE